MEGFREKSKFLGDGKVGRKIRGFEVGSVFNSYLKLDTTQLSFEDFENLLVSPSIPDKIDLGPCVAIKVDSKDIISNCAEKVNDVLSEWETKGAGHVYCQHLPFWETGNEVISEYSVKKGGDLLFVSRLIRSSKNLTEGIFIFRGVLPNPFYILFGRELISYFLFNQKQFGLSTILALDRDKMSVANSKNLIYKIERGKISEKLFSLLEKLKSEKTISKPLSAEIKQKIPNLRDESRLNYVVFTFSNLRKNFSSFEEIKNEVNEVCLEENGKVL